MRKKMKEERELRKHLFVECNAIAYIGKPPCCSRLITALVEAVREDDLC